MRNAYLLIVLAACEFPSAGRFPCAPDGACSDGNVCIDQVCVPEPASCAKAVTAGGEHTCALRDDGTAWCWGRNDLGQLGDGTTEDRIEPVQVVGDQRFVSIAAGSRHTCALADDGSTWCWGSNLRGQTSGTTEAITPIRVAGVDGATAIAVGGDHGCAVVSDSTVRCWGANGSGQIGNGTRMDRRIPDTVVSLGGITAIVAASDTSCAIDGAGALWCWGKSGGGQFGDSAIQSRTEPVAVPVSTPVSRVAMGDDFLCTLTATGAVECLGNNLYGQLGTLIAGSESDKAIRVRLPVAAGDIAAGARFACATEAEDEQHARRRMWCWGEDRHFQLADGIGADHEDPAVTRYEHVESADGGGSHLCALSTTGGITCSGYNGRGQLGDGHRTTQSTPASPVVGLEAVTSIAAGGTHSCAVVQGSVQCWGRNNNGQLGDGSNVDRSVPVRVEGVAGAVEVVAGINHTCAMLADGTAMCWGDNVSGQLGNESLFERRAVAGPVIDVDRAPLDRITQLAAGGEHTCALLDDGIVTCWGDNGSGQLGMRICSSGCVAPGPVALPQAAREIAVGYRHSCALLADQTVMCWGGDDYGQLGNGRLPMGEPLNSSAPVAVTDLAGIEHIFSHGHFTCAIASDGSARCWGAGEAGQLGGGSISNRAAPGDFVSGVTGATEIASGELHACAIAASGLQCWGVSELGQVGDGYGGDATMPTLVSLGERRAIRLAGGDQHTCALLEGGTVTCWGDGRLGQLGNGEIDLRSRVAPRLQCP
jgi:alpha-tubulin suppressor-like RCC1 family protein